MIILVGESGSGKSTIERILEEKYGYKRTISYTTRPPRKDEKDGVDYYFITEDEFVDKFHNKFFVETGAYNGWFYGTTREQYTDNTVCVLTPHGLRQIMKNIKDESIAKNSFYIKVPRRDRLIKMLERGDNIDETIRRSQSDVGQFDGIEDEVEFIIENEGYINSPEEITNRIILEIDRQRRIDN